MGSILSKKRVTEIAYGKSDSQFHAREIDQHGLHFAGTNKHTIKGIHEFATFVSAQSRSHYGMALSEEHSIPGWLNVESELLLPLRRFCFADEGPVLVAHD